MDKELMETYRGCNIYVFQDDFPDCNPRDWCNLGRMICFHGRYDLGDKKDISEEQEPNRFASYIEGTLLQNYPDDYQHPDDCPPEVGVAMPLYLYDHSGITMNCHGFSGIDSARWDWGRVGYIYVTKDTLRKEYKAKRVTKKLIEGAEAILLQEVKAYSAYLEGDVVGWVAKDDEGNQIESVGGYVGFCDNRDYMVSEARAAIDAFRRTSFEQTRLPGLEAVA